MKIPTLYYRVGKMIFKSGANIGFKRYENGKWIDDEKWFGKIYFSDFDDFEYISKEEAKKL